MSDDQLSAAFAAIADPTRRDIVARLSVGDLTLVQLATKYEMSVQAISKHLKVLEAAGLVTKTKDGQRRPCHLEREVFGRMQAWLERYSREIDERYTRLDRVLDNELGDL